MTMRKAFGLIMMLFFGVALLVSLIAWNDWHSLAIFVIGGVGAYLYFKE